MQRAFFLASLLTALPLQGADWPMWRYDVGRTAESREALPDKLTLLWHRALPKPRPAFQDVRLQFDGGYEPIVKGKRLILASNCEDKVSAYHTETGNLLWECFTNGPVRLAPVAWQDRVLFGSDDGHFYCVSAETGKPVWKFQAVPSDRKLIGNKRLISVWPIRGGPVVHAGRVYFAAGVWPFEGVFIYCLNAATGKQIWINDRCGHLYGQQPHNAVAIGGIAPQGYLLIDDNELVVPSSNAYPGRFDLETGKLIDFKLPLGGRLPGGWYASLPGKTTQKKTQRKSLLADLGINVMRHEDRLRAEGLPEVRTTIQTANQEFKFAAGFQDVPDPVHSMVAADEKLFLTTTTGGLYAFGASNGRAPLHHPAPASGEPAPTPLGTTLLPLIARHGYGVFLGGPDALTLRHLAAHTELHLVVVEGDSARAASLRHALAQAGLLGSRVNVQLADPATVDLPPYFAHFIFVHQNVTPFGRERVFESVRPFGGKLLVETAQGVETIPRLGALPGSTNYAGDFTASLDELVKAPLGVLWFDDTLGHFKRSPQPKFIDGVMISTDKTWTDASTRGGGVDYRLLPPNFTDVYTGRVLSDDEAAPLKTQPSAKIDLKTVQPSQYRPPTQKNPWKPDPPKAGYRRNPLTGETEERVFPKSYGCDGGFDYGHIYTLRSGTAAFYDKRIDSGTINLSGPRSGCTNSVIPANGLLNVPYFYKGCTCSYPASDRTLPLQSSRKPRTMDHLGSHRPRATRRQDRTPRHQLRRSRRPHDRERNPLARLPGCRRTITRRRDRHGAGRTRDLLPSRPLDEGR